ncbi:MAG: helix-turn-helix domain-containing protein [Planctomycetes bacterium]|nr:helix-turn-helix domain-containing protein [Planctomycetota bacterium]
MDDPTSQELFARYRAGEDRAASEIFDRYVRRLIELARQRISSQLARRVDPEDIVQSAYRSFFIHARDGDFVLKRAGDLWRLLAGITLNKLHGQVERHTAGRRDIGRELRFEAGESEYPATLTASTLEPTPDEAAALAEQLDLFMASLSTVERRVLELRLQGETIVQIGTAVGRSQRTVRRLLQQVQARLENELRND